MIEQTISMLGLKARDRVTGFSGVISSVSFDLYGCVLAILTPAAGADGKAGESHWFDVKRLAVVDRERVMDAPVFPAVAGTERGPAERPKAMPHT
jgi:hypothetical protein